VATAVSAPALVPNPPVLTGTPAASVSDIALAAMVRNTAK
jgi:hypothetical protein